jgi:hypothetical protein
MKWHDNIVHSAVLTACYFFLYDRQRLDASRKRYAVLKRKLESEFGELDSMEAKVAELEAMRKVRMERSHEVNELRE